MKIFIALFFCLFTFFASAQAKVSVKKDTHNFGRFVEGPDSVHVFTIDNIGTLPLVIIDVISPCGCTAREYTKEPILPGKTGTITVRYTSKDHVGMFNKSLQVKTNDPVNDVVMITITGEVVAPSIPVKE